MIFPSFPRESCLYVGKFKGQNLIFLHQVDDFSIASTSSELASPFLDMLDSHLKQKFKNTRSSFVAKWIGYPTNLTLKQNMMLHLLAKNSTGTQLSHS